MNELERIEKGLESIRASMEGDRKHIDRISLEIRFAQRLVDAKPEKKSEWQPLIDKAIEYASSEVKKRPLDINSVVAETENILEPIGKAAKEYTVYCVGHAHIDMNWMWNWPETVSVVNDTFSTVDKLMDEFPEFHFSQSQASTYMILKEYLPELYEKVKKRVREGRWEVAASTWVEAEKNLASGEIMCRHLLYTKRFITQEFSIPIDAIKIDWEPDMFGHAHTVPGIISKAGVKRYYFCRGGKGQRLFWWQGKDGSRVLAFDDAILWYNGQIPLERAPFPDMTHLLFDYEKSTGLKDYLFVYGVGDHGGGPTRRDLVTAIELNSWPIFPKVKLGTTEEYFSVIEPQLPDDLPVIEDELNFVFRGCYTSQTNIKTANRFGENRLVEAEAAAVLAWRLLGKTYPSDDLFVGWRNTMFNQFHDIIPGSGVKATYEYAQGLFQETLTRTSMVKTNSLRSLAANVDTTDMNGAPEGDDPGSKVGIGIGAGAGHESSMGGISTLSGGAVSSEPFLIFNPNPWARNELAVVRIWDKNIPNDRVKITSASGDEISGQVTDRGNYWGHSFQSVAFPVENLPPMGYRVYSVSRSYSVVSSQADVKTNGYNILENEFFRVEVDQRSGAISSLVDKRTGYDLVPEGKRMGFLQWLLEAPHGMTAWEIGQIVKQIDLLDGATIDMPHRGPYLGAIRSHHKLNDSRFTTEISLKAGVPRVDFKLSVNWLERGYPEYGVPMLKVVFPVAIQGQRARFEIPCGYIERPADGSEVPSQKWVDLTGERIDRSAPVGVTLLNDCKYGHNVSEDEIKLTLIRSSYDPDPLPELGQHEIKFALVPHDGSWEASDAAKAGYEFNHPIEAVATDVHEGDLPKEQEFISVSPSNILLSGIKKAEDDDGLILRFYEMDGIDTDAEIRLDPSMLKSKSPLDGESASHAIETDILERPLAQSTAEIDDDVLKFSIPAFGITTVKIG
jgi:alpha-mannosidase